MGRKKKREMEAQLQIPKGNFTSLKGLAENMVCLGVHLGVCFLQVFWQLLIVTHTLVALATASLIWGGNDNKWICQKSKQYKNEVR